MKKLFLLISIITGFGLSAQSPVKNVDTETFKNYLGTENTVLLDLRTDEEIQKRGMIKGAKQIDYFGKDSEKQIAALDKTKTYLIYCAGGGRSSQCAELMVKEGFTNIIHLEKGFDEWKKKGFEIAQPK